MDTSRWTAWVALMARSDAVLVQLATMAVAAVLLWEFSRRLRAPWRQRARDYYLTTLFGFFLYLLAGYSAPLATALGLGVAVWCLGEVFHRLRRAMRPKPAQEISTVENLSEEIAR